MVLGGRISRPSRKGALSSIRGKLYLMADYCTGPSRIPDRLARGCWARRQLRNGIRDMLVPSKLMISLRSLEGVLGIIRGELHRMADYSTNA